MILPFALLLDTECVQTVNRKNSERKWNSYLLIHFRLKRRRKKVKIQFACRAAMVFAIYA